MKQNRHLKGRECGKCSVFGIFRALALLGFLLLAGEAWASAGQVAVLYDGNSPVLSSLARQVKGSIQALAGGEAGVSFAEFPGFAQAGTPADARKALLAAAKTPRVRAVVAVGHVAALAALEMGGKLGKPLVLVFRFDPDLILADKKSLPAGTAVAGASGRVRADLAALGGILPDKGEVHILVDDSLLRAQPDLPKRLAAEALAQGMRASVLPLPADAEAALAGIPEGAKAVYVCPGHPIPAKDRPAFYEALAQRKTWTFSGEGRADVPAGALAGQWPDVNEQLARNAALCTVELLEKPGAAGVSGLFTPAPELTIGEAAARAVGYDPSWKTVENAEVVGAETTEALPGAEGVLVMPATNLSRTVRSPGAPELSLRQAVSRALSQNAGLAAARSAQEERNQDKNLVMTQLFPQVGGQLGYQQVDDNQAERSLEFIPLHQTTGGVSVSQLIFSDPVISDLRAALRDVEAGKWELAARTLDLAQAAENLYLDCLASGAEYAIAQFNLGVTIQNLDLAVKMKEAGAVGAREVYRWEVQKAQDQRSVLSARSMLEYSLLGLNRIMGSPQSERWNLDDMNADKLAGPLSREAFGKITESPERYDALRTGLVAMALENSPELMALSSLAEAEGIRRGRIKRSFAVPEAAAQFQYLHIFDQDFEDPAWPPGMTVSLPPDLNLTGLYPKDSDNHWTLSFTLSWPFLEGGAKFVGLRKSSAAMERLAQLKIESRREVEMRVRRALITAARARADMDLAARASHAADQNFAISQKAYARGESSVIELLDAQEEMVFQRKAMVLAGYEYVRAAVEVERACAKMTVLMQEGEAEAFMKDLAAMSSGGATRTELPDEQQGEGK